MVEETDSERFQRQRELDEISRSRSIKIDDDDEKRLAQANRREAMTRELREIASIRSTAANKWETDVTAEKLEQAKDQRARELQEIAAMRSSSSSSTSARPNWDNSNNDDSITRSNRDVVLSNRREEKASSASTTTRDDKDDHDLFQSSSFKKSSTKEETKTAGVVSRRIGNLFSRDPGEWAADPEEIIEEFLRSPQIAALPDPPSKSNNNKSMANPPPPPRDSSKDYMREFSATDRKAASWGSKK